MKRFMVALIFLTPAPAEAGLPDCTPDNYYCTDVSSRPIFAYDFAVVADLRHEVTTSDLQDLPGSAPADTVIWVINKSTRQVVAVNDNGPSGLASQVEFTPTTSFTARALVAAKDWNTYGTADISITRDGVEILPAQLQQDQPFGGYSKDSYEAYPGDIIFVGPLAPSTGTTTAYLFTNSSLDCSGSCGTADLPYLSTFRRVDVSTPTTAGRVLVGSDTAGAVGTRMFHSRVSGSYWPSDPAFQDRDGDGLTNEIEAELGTCDSPTGPAPDCDACLNDVFPADCPATTCRCFARRGSSSSPWNPRDTDGDGIGDLTEIFQMYLGCPDDPNVPPYYMNSCVDRTRAQNACQGFTICYTVPVASLGTDPTEYDVLIELDSLSPDGIASHFLTAQQLVTFGHIFDGEGLECSDTTSTDLSACPADLMHYRRMVVHVLADQIISPEPSVSTFWTAREISNVHLNKWFSYPRKHSKLFRYGLMLGSYGHPWGGGMRLVSTRESIFLAHELGHTLDLDHGGPPGAPSGEINYPSLMSWSSYSQAPKASPGQSMLPADTGSCCLNNGVCGSGFCDTTWGPACVPAQSCEIERSWDNARFSRGVHPVLDGVAGIPETGHSPKLAADVRTWSNYGGRAFLPRCIGATCDIDWNEDGNYTGTQGADLDRDGSVTAADLATDFDDWTQMYSSGRRNLGETSSRPIRVYSSSFNSNAADYSGWQQSPAITATGYDTAGAPDSGTYVIFDGVDDGFTLAEQPWSQAMGVTLNGVAPDGFRVDLMFNLDAITSNTVDYLLDSQLVRLHLTTNVATQKAVLGTAVHNGSSWGSTLSYGASLDPGTWYWVQMDWDRARIRLRVIPWDATNGQWDQLAGDCDDSALAYVSDRSPGAITVGQTTGGLRHFPGRMDEVRIWAHTPCQDFSKLIICPSDVAKACNWCPHSTTCPDGGLQ